jgi:hypothetical protein
MTDLPERLRRIAETVDDWNAPIMAKDDLTRAADEIERLRAWIRDRRANERERGAAGAAILSQVSGAIIQPDVFRAEHDAETARILGEKI